MRSAALRSGLTGAEEKPTLRTRIARLADVVYSPLYGLMLVLAIVSLITVALLHVWTRLEVIRIGYALSEQTKLHRALREHEQRFRLELATRKDPAAIERVAREQLHMAPPDPSAIRIISAQRGSGPRRPTRRGADAARDAAREAPR